MNDVVAGYFPFVIVARDRSPSPAGGTAAKNLLGQYRPCDPQRHRAVARRMLTTPDAQAMPHADPSESPRAAAT